MKKQETRSAALRIVRSRASEPERPRAQLSIGTRIRDLRKSKGWSLARLSSDCGIPQSTLSKFETNNLSLPLDRLFRVADALGVAVTHLFDAHATTSNRDAPGRRSISRAGEGRHTATPGYDRHWLFPELIQKRMFPLVQSLLARDLSEFGELIRHEGEEFAIVLKGKVLVVTDIYEPILLNELDGIYFDSRMGHAYLNAGEGEATILNVATNVLQFASADAASAETLD